MGKKAHTHIKCRSVNQLRIQKHMNVWFFGDMHINVMGLNQEEFRK